MSSGSSLAMQPAAADSSNAANHLGVGVQPASGLSPQRSYPSDDPALPERLRIANGGAGQSGLIGEWANAFIEYRKRLGDAPFKIGWYLGDTTESLKYLAKGCVDIAVTYSRAAEQHSLDTGAAIYRMYGFRDHFYLVGPKSNPACLRKEDSVLSMLNQIVTTGNDDIKEPPNDRDPVRFLSRFDKSATNIKESRLFIEIGQVPWGQPRFEWYHQYPNYPLEALKEASLRNEYTLTDRGTWLSSPKSVTDSLEIFKEGGDIDPKDYLLNPAHLLLAKSTSDSTLCRDFMRWVADPNGGQKVIREFKRGDPAVPLYSEAPRHAGIDSSDKKLYRCARL